MNDDHWFDALNKRLTSTAPRRGILGAAAALPVLQHLGAPDAAGKGGGKGGKHKGGGKGKGGGGKRGHGKGNGNKKPKPLKPRGICDRTWPGQHQQGQRDHCRFINRQCPEGGDLEFCIVDNYPGHEGEKVADCCDEGERCCGHQCCPEGRMCCNGECCRDGPAGSICCEGRCIALSDGYGLCCDGKYRFTWNDREHCGACGNPCGPNEECSRGQCVCANGSPTTCNHECPDGLTKCGDECVDLQTNPDHCGYCFSFNPNGLPCCDGNPCHYVNGVCCGGTCYPEGWPSCE